MKENQQEEINLDYIKVERKESEHTSLIYSSEDNWYSLGFSNNKQDKVRIALGTFMENQNNRIDILEINDYKTLITKKMSIEHSYPATKLKWGPYYNNVF